MRVGAWLAVGVVACGPGDPRPPRAEPTHEPHGCTNTLTAWLDAGHRDAAGGAAPLEESLPDRLSETILYDDPAALTVHPALRPFTPRYELWSDGADKRRWAYVPECASIDTRDVDDWNLPVGTVLFKEFSRDGKRLETRIIARMGPGPRDFAMASYAWDASGSDATRVGPDGLPDVLGTTHDIPSRAACQRCHGSFTTGGGRPSRALGFSAIQLAHDGDGVTLAGLVGEGLLSHDPPLVDLPGDATTRDALGTLHANCGHCHNHTADGVPQVDLDLWVDVGATDPAETGAWRTAVGVPNTLFNDQHVTARVEPGDPDRSAVWVRMAARGSIAQMPPVGSDVTDAAGLDRVRAWIVGLP